jgi:putative addiction module component (TIGR02574 family)
MQSWPIEQQLDFVFRAWDQMLDSGWQPDLSEASRAELDRRLKAYEAEPNSVFTWEQVIERVI